MSLSGLAADCGIGHNTATARANAGLTSNLYFWRDRSGLGMDCVMDRGTALVRVKVKSGQNLSGDFFAGFERFAGP